MGEVCQVHELAMRNFDIYSENQKEVVLKLTQLGEKMVALDGSCKSAHHRLDSQEDQTKAIIKMSMSMENMARQMEETVGLIKDHDNRIEVLEHSPGETVLSYWKIFVGALITMGAGSFVGFVISRIG